MRDTERAIFADAEDDDLDLVAAPFDTVCECGEPKRPDDELCDDCSESNRMEVRR